MFSFRRSLAAGIVAAASMALTTMAGATERTPAPEGAAVAIIQPANGASVTSPVTVYFGLSAFRAWA